MTGQQDLQTLIRTHQRRLQKLKEKEAMYGLNTPPEVLIEIEDLEAKLTDLRRQFHRDPDDPGDPGSNVYIGDVHGNISGNIAGRDVNQTIGTQINLSGESRFAAVYRHLATRPDDPVVTAAELVMLVKRIEAEAVNGAAAGSKALQSRLAYLDSVAPDVAALARRCLA